MIKPNPQIEARNDYEKGKGINNNPYKEGSSAYLEYAAEMQRQLNIELREIQMAAGNYA